MKASLEEIRATAGEIIRSIDGHFAELQKGEEINQGNEESSVKEFLDCLSKNDKDGMLRALHNLPFVVESASYTTNGNAIESQEALFERGDYKISARFFNRWNPMQVVAPSEFIKQKLEIVLFKNENPTAIRTLAEKKSTSLKNAESNYHEMLKQWKGLTKQKEITYDPQYQKKSVLSKLQENRGRIIQSNGNNCHAQHMKEVSR